MRHHATGVFCDFSVEEIDYDAVRAEVHTSHSFVITELWRVEEGCALAKIASGARVLETLDEAHADGRKILLAERDRLTALQEKLSASLS